MKKWISMILICLLLVSMTACSNDPSQEVKIGIMPDVDSIPFMIAEEMGYFDDEGVNVTLINFTSPVDRDGALQSGELDGAISDVLAACFSKDNDFDVVITSMTNGSYKLLVSKNSEITEIDELKDKDIAMSLNTIIEYTTDRMLEESGLTGDDVNKVSIPQIPTRLEMLQNDKIDAATLPEPLASVAIAGGAKLLNSSDNLDINPGILLFKADAIEEKSVEIQAVYSAYNKAVEYLQEHPVEDYMNILVDKVGFPEEFKESIVLPEYHKASLPSEKDVTEVVNWLNEKQLIENNYQYDELVDSSFIED